MNERFTRAPHHNDRSSTPSPNAALLIDFDNVTMGIRSNLGQELRQLLNSDIIRGKVSVQRAYADWRRYPQYVVPLSEAAIDLIYAPAYGSSKKNATDIRLAIDALELVFTRPEIGTFILLSGDSDFSSLVLKLKEYGKYVIGVGMQESSSDLLVQNCDEYYSYDSLSGLVTADEMDTKRHDPWELTEHSIKKMVERNDVMRSDRLKQVMLELDPSFDEKEIGYSKFNRFLTEASSRGILKLQKIGNGQYKVGPGSSVDVETPSGGDEGRQPEQTQEREPQEREEKQETRGERGGGTPPRDLSDEGGEPDRERSRSDGGDGGGQQKSRQRKAAAGDRPVVEAEQLRAGYDLLQEVVADLAGGDGRVRDSEVKREMVNRDSSFDEGALGFSKFSRFIRQAHDEEVVDITKDSDGNYYLEPVGGAERGAPERQPEPEPEPEPEPAAGPEPAPEPEASREEEEPEPSPEPDAELDVTAASDEEEEEEEEGRTEEKPSEPKKPVGGLRRRRKSKDEEKSGSGDESWVPGPVDSGGDDDGTETTAASTSGTSGREGPDSSTSGRRGVGRFRRGRKSGRDEKDEKDDESGSEPTPGPVTTTGSDREGGDDSDPEPQPSASDAPEPESPAPAEKAAAADRDGSPGRPGRESTGGGGESDADEIVQHMKERYSGVGEKTARKLVDEFGEETLSVIDEDPRRVENLLPKHRAEAVLQARAAERQSERGAGGDRD